MRGRLQSLARRLAAAMAAVLAIGTYVALTPSTGSAFTVEQCRQPSSNVGYSTASGISGDYATAASGAISSWNTATGINFYRSSSPTVSLNAVNFGNTGYDGITHYWCYGANYLVANAYFNTYYTSGYGPYGKRQVMAHELGHTLGLWEAQGNSCTGLPLMYPNSARYYTCGVYTPQQDDINGINYLYPGSNRVAQDGAVHGSRAGGDLSMSTLTASASSVAVIEPTGRSRVEYVTNIPFTVSTVRVVDALSGTRLSGEIEIRQPGVSSVESQNVLKPGGRYLAFLEPFMLEPGLVVNPSEYVVAGGGAGLYASSGGAAYSKVDVESPGLPLQTTVGQVQQLVQHITGSLGAQIRWVF